MEYVRAHIEIRANDFVAVITFLFLSCLEQPWCCVEGRKAGGKIELLADGWSIQMYGQHRMNSRGALANEHPPTKVFFSGSWLNVPFNPGLYVRNRYGREVYKHAEHWLSTGKLSGWDTYEAGMFGSCPVKGFHGCLDQYHPDGSIQFENNFLSFPHKI